MEGMNIHVRHLKENYLKQIQEENLCEQERKALAKKRVHKD